MTPACPQCASINTAIASTDPLSFHCNDCATIFEQPKPPTPPPKRHRRPPGERKDKEGQVYHDTLERLLLEKPAPSPEDIGPTTAATAEVLSGGPRALIQAHKDAEKLSKRFGEEFQAQWFLDTDYIRQLETTHAPRAKFARLWRPRFLAALALTHSIMIGCRAGKVTHDTMSAHKKADPDFAAQIEAAEAHAVALLHDVCWRRAVEGDVEPVFWQGIRVGSIKKFDGKLQIEMLRAHLPQKFKSPGAQLSVNVQNNVLVLGEQDRAVLMEKRRQALTAQQERQAQQLPPSS